MRARMKRRRRNRRLALVLSLIFAAALIGAAIYAATISGEGSGLDSKDNQPVSSADSAGIAAASVQPFGPAPTATMLSAVRLASGSSWNTGKPVVLFVGEEYCMYCALQRWALVVALSRFGDFSGLKYMTSGANEGDLPTFTFVGSTYSSGYITFRPYEIQDRANPPHQLQTLPSNYSAILASYGGGVPFLDFGNRYVLSGSPLSDISILQGKNWTTIINSIAGSDSSGSQIREAANLITGVICKLTQGSPASVCNASPIDTTTSGIAGPTAAFAIPEGTTAYPMTAPSAGLSGPPRRASEGR